MASPSLETLLFCSANSGYRIIRLSMEYFLVEHTLEAGYSVALAGSLFVVSNICDIACNIIFLYYPYFFLGSKIGSIVFVIVTPILMISGYVGFFLSTESFAQMAVCMGLCGFGISCWYVNYKTLFSTSYNKEALGRLAQLRQGFESIGFLIPSICLAIVTISKRQEQEQEDSFSPIGEASPRNEHSPSLSIITRTALVLAAIASIFFIISMQIMYKYACQVSCTEIPQQEKQPLSFWQVVKTFFTTSLLRFSFINTVILGLFNLLPATLSTISSMYFALDPLDLWIAAIGFPLGGIITTILALTFGSFKTNRRFMLSGGGMITVFTIMTCTIEPANRFFTDNKTDRESKFLLFMFGWIIGFFCSESMTVSVALWLKSLNSHPQSFINQANALGNMGDRLLIASVFQFQTLLLDRALDHQDNDDINLQAVGIFIFVPFIVLIGFSAYLVIFRPSEYFDISKLAGRGNKRISPITKLYCRFVSLVSGISLETMLYGAFCIFRRSSFAKHLIDVEVQNATHLNIQDEENKKKWNLSVDDLQEYLKLFASIDNPSSTSSPSNNIEEELFVSEENVKLQRVIVESHDALQTRFDIIESAKDSIWILTQPFDGCLFDLLADKLIQKYQRDGIQTQIIVDRSLIYYEAERSNMTGFLSNCFEKLTRLCRTGINVRLLDTWYDGDGTPAKPDYSIGVHREMLLVDNQWLLIGGHLIDDKHFGKPTGFCNIDLGVLLSGNFEDSTLPLVEKLWNDATDVASAIHQVDTIQPGGTTNDPNGNNTSTTLTDIEACQIQTGQLPPSYGDESNNNNKNNISLVQLDHKGGNEFGKDIILSTLIFMIETAEHSVDLAFGMFHLFPPLEDALERAVKRSVRVRLFTNSPQSNNMWYLFGEVMAISTNRLLDIGVEVYVPKDNSINTKKSENNFPNCLHYKFATADNHCAMVGSWNCFGTSVFYDSEFSVIMFDQSNNEDEKSPKNSISTGKIHEYLEEQLNQGEMVQLQRGLEIPKLPSFFGLFVDESANRIAKRGY